jgi:hypothetical protein
MRVLSTVGVLKIELTHHDSVKHLPACLWVRVYAVSSCH